MDDSIHSRETNALIRNTEMIAFCKVLLSFPVFIYTILFGKKCSVNKTACVYDFHQTVGEMVDSRAFELKVSVLRILKY